MTNIDPQIVRHLLLRFCLGFILVWFGTQQLVNPGEWTGFVPEFVSSHSPVSGVGLILAHGALLLLSGIGISFGVFPKSASLLAAALLLEIIVVLFLKGNSGGLIVRDVGLLGMAVVLTIDRFQVFMVRFPQILPQRS
jgi:uncharacterized membrane protein YphA (DoxX/SURF4 family)